MKIFKLTRVIVEQSIRPQERVIGILRLQKMFSELDIEESVTKYLNSL